MVRHNSRKQKDQLKIFKQKRHTRRLYN